EPNLKMIGWGPENPIQQALSHSSACHQIRKPCGPSRTDPASQTPPILHRNGEHVCSAFFSCGSYARVYANLGEINGKRWPDSAVYATGIGVRWMPRQILK